MKVLKVAICGDRAVGKSVLCSRLSGREPDFNYLCTAGVDIMIKEIKDQNIKIFFTDMSGDVRFEAITSIYVKTSNVLLFVYDIENLESLQRIKKLYFKYKNDLWSGIPIIVGTHNSKKFDKYYLSEGLKFAEEKNIRHFLVDSVINTGTYEVLSHIVRIAEKLDDVESIIYKNEEKEKRCTVS